jgi:hypothetical protein
MRVRGYSGLFKKDGQEKWRRESQEFENTHKGTTIFPGMQDHEN